MLSQYFEMLLTTSTHIVETLLIQRGYEPEIEQDDLDGRTFYRYIGGRKTLTICYDEQHSYKCASLHEGDKTVDQAGAFFDDATLVRLKR